jgi:probable rRNA maturation factor
MAVNVFNQTGRRGYLKYRTDFAHILRRCRQVLDLSGPLAVSVIFTDDPRIREINRQYRGIDRPTDVISFALRDDQQQGDYVPEELGDIFINLDAAVRQAEEYGHSQRREICFLFTHGLLHLCGFDHQTPQQEKEMIRYQKQILDDLVGPDE